MAEKKRRRLEPEGRVELGDGVITHEFGISGCQLARLSKKIPLAVELPFDTGLRDILHECFGVLARYGIERPDPEAVADVMRILGREPLPADRGDPEFLYSGSRAYVAAMVKDRIPDEAKENLAHPVQLAMRIIMKIGELRQLCRDGFDLRWAVDMAAGIGAAYARLEMALAHERDALIGKRVRTGNREQLAERNRKRREMWAAELAAAARDGSGLKHGEIGRIVRKIAAELGTSAEAERRWCERNMRQRRPR